MSNLLKSKFFLGVMIVAVLAVGFAVSTSTASAASCTITTTLRVGSSGAEVMCLQTAVGVTADGAFGPKTKAAVMTWQTAHGLTADGIFGPMSRAAWMGTATTGGSFPAGCSSASGYSTTTGQLCSGGVTNLPAGCTSTSGFSPTTGQACNSGSTLPAGCTSTSGFSSTTGVSCSTGAASTALTGGAGSVDTYSLDSSLNSETVGEGQADVQVAGLKIKPSTSSDLSITAIKVVLAGGDDRFIKYATDVSFWYNGKEIGRVPASTFTPSNTYTSTISFSTPAVIKAGQTGDIIMAITGNSTIDSALWVSNGGTAWTVDFTSVRWADAQGALISEDPGTGTRTIDFDSATSGAKTTVNITAGDTSVNTAHVVTINDSTKTNNVSLLSFKMKVQGDSPIYLDSLPIMLTGAGSANGYIDEIVSGGLTLSMDGNAIGSSDLSSDAINSGSGAIAVDYGSNHTSAGYRFKDLATVLQPGTHTFLVTADIKSESDITTQGSSLYATFGETQDNWSSFQAYLGSTSNGDTLADADVTGSVNNSGNAIVFYSKGINVSLVSTSAVRNISSDPASTVDSGTFTIKFNVTAVGTDEYVNKPAIDDQNGDGTTAANAAGQGIVYSVLRNGAASDSKEAGTDEYAAASAILTATGDTSGDNTNVFKVLEGQSRSFTLTVTLQPDALAGATDGNYQVLLDSVNWGIATNTSNANYYTSNLSNFITDPAYLNDY